MWSLGIVVSPPPLGQDLSFLQSSEDLGVRQLIPELASEAFIVAVFPRAPWCDVEGFDPDFRQPFPHGRGNELRTAVRSDMIRWSMASEQMRQARQHDDRPGEHALVASTSWDLALFRQVLAKNSAGPALGDIEHRTHMIDTGTAKRGA